MSSLTAIRAASARHFREHDAPAMLHNVDLLCRHFQAAKTQTERLKCCAAMLTALLAAAEFVNLESYRSRILMGSRGPLESLRYYSRLGNAAQAADAIAGAFAAYWELLSSSRIWVSQVKAVAWRALQEQVLN